MNCEGLYFAKMFFQNFCPCFDIVFPQLEIIPRTRNKFVEIVAVAERYLIITHVKNKESKQLPFRICLHVKLAEGRISKKRQNFFVPNLQYCQSGQDGKKQNLFHQDKSNMNL